MAITPEDRKNFEHLGEAHVRYRVATDGFNSPFRTTAMDWLVELDEAKRSRDEALQVEQTQLAKSTSRAAWYAVYAALGALVVSLLGTAYAIYSQHESGVAAKAEVARHKMIREGIGMCIASGNDLLRNLGKNQIPVDVNKINQWISDTEKFLRANLDNSFVRRFNDLSDAPMAMGSTMDPEHFNAYEKVNLKVKRLEEFSHELP